VDGFVADIAQAMQTGAYQNADEVIARNGVAA
jgi:hypothetical protein